MSQATIFLGVAVAALLAGNGVLELLKARRRRRAAGISSVYNAVRSGGRANPGQGGAMQGDSLHGSPAGNSPFGLWQGQRSTPDPLHPAPNQPCSNYVTAVSAQFSSAPLEKKIELAHWRLQALESKVRAMQGIYDDATRTKIDKLEAFRATANAEIIALKEIVEELQKKRHKANGGNGVGNGGNGSGKPQAAQAESIPTDELRRIIYRSQN